MRERGCDGVTGSEAGVQKVGAGSASALGRKEVGSGSGSGARSEMSESRRNGRSPYITPLLGAHVLMRPLESNFGEVNLADATWSPRVFAMEFPDKAIGINVLDVCPGVLFISESSPRDEVLEFAAEDAAVHDFFNLPVFFAIDDVGFGNFSAAATGDRIAWRG